MLDEESQTLLIGAAKGILKQYNLKTGELVKEYNNLQVGNITSLSLFYGIACVSGDYGHFNLIDIRNEKELIRKSFDTLLNCIKTSQFCVIGDEHPLFVLTVSGSMNFNNRTSIMIFNLFDKFNISGIFNNL